MFGFLIDEYGSAEPNTELVEKPEPKHTGKCETVSDQSSSEHDRGIAESKSDHSPRKRQGTHLESNEKRIIGQKKRNYGLEATAVVRSLALQPKETTTKTEKEQDNLKQIQTSPGLGNTSSELVQCQSELQTEQTTVPAREKALGPVVIKSSNSCSELSTTSLFSKNLPSLLKYPGLFYEDVDRDT